MLAVSRYRNPDGDGGRSSEAIQAAFLVAIA
jgi:hypothetical protein